VWRKVPMLAPCTVIDIDPVPAELPRRKMLSTGESIDHPCVMLPILEPTVITDRLVLPDPCPVRQRTDVSDSHSVPSHPELPCRTLTLCLTIPMFAPCTVVDTDPVPAELLRLITLSPTLSTVQAALMLPSRLPAVITNLRVPPAP
jgi:hypothetical protein